MSFRNNASKFVTLSRHSPGRAQGNWVKSRLAAAFQVGLGGIGALALMGLPTLAGAQSDYVPGRLLVRFKSEVGALRALSTMAEFGARKVDGIPAIGIDIVELPAGANERAYANAFCQRSDVEFAELDGLTEITAIPDDPYVPNEWHLAKLQAFSAWDTTFGSNGITIAIVDSGVDGTHPDLQSRMVPGWNFSSGNSDTSDVLNHGTPVAGSAAATWNNATGVAGLAGGCRIMPLRVTDTSGSASFSAIASAITYAADHGARIVSASLAMVNSGTIDTAAQYLMNRGGLYFMASGNSGANVSGSNSPHVVTVSASDQNDLRASFSTYGTWVDVAAPGVSIYTTWRGGGYGYFGGTSSATPVASAVAALALSANSNLTATQLLQVVTSSADDLGVLGWDVEFGWGRVNAFKAVQAALGTGADKTPPVVSFSAPLSGESISGTRTVFVSATDNVQVDSVELYINGVLKSTMTGTPYQWSWNTLSYANGTYTLTAIARDHSGNSATATRSVTVSNLADTTPPTVAITSPIGGTTVSTNQTVTVSASDNRGVTKVELYVDGVLKETDTSAPWSFRVNTRQWAPGNHTLVAKAFDAAGNSSLSSAVTVRK
jgi:thermitase